MFLRVMFQQCSADHWCCPRASYKAGQPNVLELQAKILLENVDPLDLSRDLSYDLSDIMTYSTKTPVAKLSVTIEPTLLDFLERYQASHARKTKSAVVEEALTLLRERELERAYREAAQEWLENPDAPLWESTAGDGLARGEW
jgi:antitoxin ParD1/3/4